jgi:hypothetical protein
VLDHTERAVEEGGGVGRDRSSAVRGPAAADPEAVSGFYDFDDTRG